MKKTTMITLLTLVLALLVQFACAEPSDTLQGVFDALTVEDSDYSQTKAMYAEYFEGIQWEEAVDGDSIVISISNSEYMDGSWTFTQEGNYLTVDFDGEDYTGPMFTMNVLQAVATYVGVDADIITGYVNGLSVLDIESDDFAAEWDDDGALSVRINDTTPWDMSALDQMVLNEDVVYPLDEDYGSTSANLGKLMMIANKHGDGMTILLGEYGGLDDLAYRSIINVASILQPAGWEDFTANYTELADAETDAYTVKLNVTMDEVLEIIDDPKDSYSFAILRFGAGDAYEEEYTEDEEYDFEPPAPAEAPTVEEFAEGYFNVLVNLESGTAGASLKTAIAASEVCVFAEAHELYNPDVEPLRANMLTAFEGLNEDEQAAFLTNFDTVRVLLDDCLEDYDANRALFEDAGVAEAMDEVMYDPLNREAWKKLRDHTLTLGNGEDD